VIRRSEVADTERIREVDRSAATSFADIGMSWVAGHEPDPAVVLDEYARSGRSWVALDDAAVVVGYVIVDVVDGHAHITQLSVERRHQGHGHGRALMAQAETWAVAEGFDMATLTTFSDVAWNRPLYEHLGYSVWPEAELSPGIRAIRDQERERGIEPPERVAMRKLLSRTRSG
jgi:GNAT superfamily N-acetyltransferase